MIIASVIECETDRSFFFLRLKSSTYRSICTTMDADRPILFRCSGRFGRRLAAMGCNGLCYIRKPLIWALIHFFLINSVQSEPVQRKFILIKWNSILLPTFWSEITNLWPFFYLNNQILTLNDQFWFCNQHFDLK